MTESYSVPSQQCQRPLIGKAECPSPMGSVRTAQFPGLHCVLSSFSPGRGCVRAYLQEILDQCPMVLYPQILLYLKAFFRCEPLFIFLPNGLCPSVLLLPCSVHNTVIPGPICANLQGDTGMAVTTNTLSHILRAP